MPRRSQAPTERHAPQGDHQESIPLPRNCAGITIEPRDNSAAKMRAALLILSWVDMRLAKGEASLGEAQSDVSLSLGARQPLGRLDASQRPATG
jgi:hypothetical protein